MSVEELNPLYIQTGGGGRTELDVVTVPAGGGSVTFDSSLIDLERDGCYEIDIDGKYEANTSPTMRFNGDTGSNYVSARYGNVSTMVSGGDNITPLSRFVLSQNTNYGANRIKGTIHIHKGGGIDGYPWVSSEFLMEASGSPGSFVQWRARGWWRSAVNVTQIDVFGESIDFAEGTVITLSKVS